MKILKNSLFLIAALALISVKYYIYSNSPRNYNSDIYTYRSYSLLNNHTDEHGIPFPVVFQSRLGYEMPLNSYLYTLFFAIFQTSTLTEFAYEIFLTIILSLSFYLLTKSNLSVYFLVLCPYFLWPGYWTEKLFLSLVFLAIKFYQSQDIPKLSLTAIFLFLTTTLALPLFFVYFATVTFQKKHRVFLKFTGFMVVIIAIFLKTFLSLPYSRNYLISQNINIVNNIESKNATNQLRGEDNTSPLFQKTSRLFHNKLSGLTSIISYSVRAYDPSLWFFNGDKNVPSSRQLLPIFLPLYVLLIFLLPFQKKHFWNIFPAIVTASIIVGLNGDISQSSLLILLPFIILALEYTFRKITVRYQLPFLLVSFIFFIPLINIALDCQPAAILSYSTQSASQIVNIINQNKNKNIYITDEVYPDLGPQIAYLLKVLPQKNSQKVTDLYQPYIRNITPQLTIISPSNPLLNIANPQVDPSLSNSIFLVSAAQYQNSPGSEFKKYTSVISDRKNQPLIYQLTYEITKK